MPVVAQVVAVTTTASVLPVTDTDRRAGMSVAIAVPSGGSTVYVGGPSVTTATGFPLPGGSSWSFDLNTPGPGYSDAPDALYLVAESTQNVNVIATGV